MHKRIFTLATICTISRIALIPYILSAMHAHAWILATTLFAAAAITDYLDGYLARSRNEQTSFGTALDPVADKLLILSTGALLFPGWLFSLLLMKECIIVVGALLIMGLGMKWGNITLLSKWATALQLTFIGLLSASHAVPWLLPTEVYFLFITIICCMSMSALLQYGYLAIRGALTHITGV